MFKCLILFYEIAKTTAILFIAMYMKQGRIADALTLTHPFIPSLILYNGGERGVGHPCLIDILLNISTGRDSRLY